MSITPINSARESLLTDYSWHSLVDNSEEMNEIAHDVITLVSAARILGKLGFKSLGRELITLSSPLINKLLIFLNTGSYIHGLAEELHSMLIDDWMDKISDQELLKVILASIKLRSNISGVDATSVNKLRELITDLIRRLGINVEDRGIIARALNLSADSLIQLVSTLTAILISKVEVMLR